MCKNPYRREDFSVNKAALENNCDQARSIELELKKQKLFDKFKDDENLNENNDLVDNSRLKNRLTVAKKKKEIERQNTYKIEQMEKNLEEQLDEQSEPQVKTELKEIDEYTKMLLGKPLHKGSRKFTKFNFILPQQS
jgi:hypothetical protein